MKLGLGEFLCYLSIAIGTLVVAPSASACSMSGCLNKGYEMRPTFTVVVRHTNKPLAGAAIHISTKGTEQSSGITDETGRVSFRNLEPGEYWLNGDFLGTYVVDTCFHINEKPTRKAKTKLRYTWGDHAPATSRIAGKLIDHQPGKGGSPFWNLLHATDVPVAGASLKLHDPLTRATYETSSDHDGQFSFEGLSNGAYVLHIEGGIAGERAYDTTDHVVAVDSSANHNWLVFKRSDPIGGSCGGTQLELQNN